MTTDGFDAIDGLTMSDELRAAMKADGIQEPSAVQVQSIPAILSGSHVVMHSGTGTGKTLSYLLPLLQMLRETPGLRAAVLSPGTELAMQTLRTATDYAPDIPAAAAVSTTSRKRQRQRVQGGTRLIVATPDRMADLFAEKKLKQVRILVLDELDPLLASKASTFLEPMLSRSEPKMQLIVASATLGGRSEAFIEKFLPDHVRVQPAADPFYTAIAHYSTYVSKNQPKEIALTRFIQEHKCRPAIVFVEEPRLQYHLERFLVEHGVRAVTVSREGSKAQRQNHLDAFRDGDATVLLTTDAIARGLDVPDVDWVLHYDLPGTSQAYVHRAGRTGRAGRQGTSVVFVDDASSGHLNRLARELRLKFKSMDARKA
jgi:ATP-dependent RNA helicase DeaD